MGWCNIQSKWKRRKISLELKAKTTLQHAYATYHYHYDDKDNDDTASDVTVAKDDDCFQHMLKLTEVYYMQSPVSRNNWHSLHWNCSFVGYLSVRPYVCMNDDCPHPRFNGRFMQYTRQSLCKTWKPPEHSTFVGCRYGSMAGYLTGICRNWCGARRNLPHGILPGLHFVFITFLSIRFLVCPVEFCFICCCGSKSIHLKDILAAASKVSRRYVVTQNWPRNCKLVFLPLPPQSKN